MVVYEPRNEWLTQSEHLHSLMVSRASPLADCVTLQLVPQLAARMLVLIVRDISSPSVSLPFSLEVVGLYHVFHAGVPVRLKRVYGDSPELIAHVAFSDSSRYALVASASYVQSLPDDVRSMLPESLSYPSPVISLRATASMPSSSVSRPAPSPLALPYTPCLTSYCIQDLKHHFLRADRCTWHNCAYVASHISDIRRLSRNDLEDLAFTVQQNARDRSVRDRLVRALNDYRKYRKVN